MSLDNQAEIADMKRMTARQLQEKYAELSGESARLRNRLGKAISRLRPTTKQLQGIPKTV